MESHDLKSAIKRLGCSQKVFAAHIGLTPEAVSRMCRGDKPIARRTELLVMEWLGPSPVNPPPADQKREPGE
jgi:plasmid maintenance system antidote protein VapI